MHGCAAPRQWYALRTSLGMVRFSLYLSGSTMSSMGWNTAADTTQAARTHDQSNNAASRNDEGVCVCQG